MPCEINTILKLTSAQGYPAQSAVGQSFTCMKSGYRLFAVDVPVQLVDEQWQAQADVIIRELTWRGGQTHLRAEVARLYDRPFAVK
jgi:hypothetical protein